MIDAMSKYTLIPLTNSWWNAANVPGKRIQMLTHVGGIHLYEEQCRGTLADWKGFTVVHGKNGVVEGSEVAEENGVPKENDILKESGLSEANGIEVGGPV